MNNNNLAYGRAVTVHNALNGKNNFIINTLTNGNRALMSESSSWLQLDSGVTEFFVDLGSPLSVCGFSVAFAHDVLNLNMSPETVKLLLSENGDEFYEVLKVSAPYPASFKSAAKATYSAELSEPCRARFAKIRFCCETSAKCGELRIFGGKSDGNEFRLSGAVFKDVSKNKFANPDVLTDGNLPLISFGQICENGEVQRLTRKDFKPFLGYVDVNGEIKSEMFKNVALCQSILGECPSGGCMTYLYDKPSRLSDWEFLIEELFADQSNLKALDEEYSSIKKQLGLDRETQLGVYLTVPVPKVSFETFGDLNGDGIEEKLLTTEDCISAFNWYVDAVTRRFNAECLSNLKIEGFVWNNNRIIREYRDDETYFVKECVSSLHNRGYKCVFIGVQRVSGVEKADKVGFDCSTLTPSSCENSVVPVCKKYGLGINIVSPSYASDREGVASFVKQLSDCISFGMLKTVHTFQNANVFSCCAYSENETERLVYDGLYEFLIQKTEPVEEPETCEKTLEEETIDENVEELFVSAEVIKEEPEEIVELEEIEEVETTPEAVKEIEEIEEIDENPISKSETCCSDEEPSSKENGFVPYEVPALTIEIKVPSSENDCPDRKCGYCSKFMEQNKTIADLDEKILSETVKKTNKKAAFVAAGIAVALGTAYLIAKGLKGNKNG